MPDIIITVVSGETTNLGLSIPGVQGPMGQSTLPSGGTSGQIIVKQSSADYDAGWTASPSGLTLRSSIASGLTLQGTVSGGTFVASTITGATINAPVISSGIADGTSLSNATINGCVLVNSNIDSTTIFASTLSGVITNIGTISGGTGNNVSLVNSTYSGGVIRNTTLSGTIANVGTISGGTYSASLISGVTVYASTLSGNTFQEVTISSGVFPSPSLITPTISGTITASGGVTVFASGNSAGFFGASPVLCPSGIVIPSGGSSTAEVLTALSGVIVALQSLGLVRG